MSRRRIFALTTHLSRPPLRPRVGQHRDAGNAERSGGEHERCAQNGADAYLIVGSAAAEQDGDERDQRLGHGRTDRGEDAADGPFVQAQVKAEPFDCVGEQLGGDQDDGEADDEEKEG